MTIDPEKAGRDWMRAAAIEERVDDLARALCGDAEELLVWLADRDLQLCDIRVTSPLGVTTDADVALMQAAIRCERMPAVSTAWVIEQINRWLIKRPELIEQAKAEVDYVEEVCP